MKSRKDFFVATSLAITLLGGGCNTSDIKTDPVAAQNEGTPAGNNTGEDVKILENIYETEAWKEIEKKWGEMESVSVKNFNEIPEKVDSEMKEMDKYLNELVEAGYFSHISGEAINFIYGENLRSVMEKTVPLPTCYTAMPVKEWDCTGIDRRETIEKKLQVLEEIYGKDGIDEKTYLIAKKDIEGRLSLLAGADEYWKEKGEGTCEEHLKETDVLLHLYDVNMGKIKEGNDVGLDLIIASEYIVLLENNN